MIEITVTDGIDLYKLSFLPSRDAGTIEIWLQNGAGEGLTMSEKNLFDIIDAHFKSEF